jgi:hypothetical protein
MSLGRCCLVALLIGLSACSSKPSTPAVDAGVDAGTPADAGPPPVCQIQFQHEQGLPCNRDADCVSGHCYHAVDPFDTSNPVVGYCTQTCDIESSATGCPTGFDCVPAAVGEGGECAPYDALPSGNKSFALGSPCAVDGDCASEKCATIDNLDGTLSSYCTQPCADAAACGECSACVPETLSSSDKRCQPMGPGAIGTKCEAREACASFDCRSFCTQACGGPNGVGCPAGSECLPVMESGRQVTICIADSQLHATANEGTCRYDLECATGSKCQQGVCKPSQPVGQACTTDNDCSAELKCRTLSPELTVCTRPCGTGCGTAEACVAFDLDTNLKLLNSSGQTIASNDSIDSQTNNLWSELRNYPTPAGTYFIEVKSFGKGAGAYKLELLSDAGAPVSVAEVSTPHAGTGSAQVVDSLPAVVSATFGAPGEVDYYKFTLASATTLTYRTSRGDPSMCLPQTAVATLGVGAHCSSDFQCMSDKCEGTLKMCSAPCTMDADCGEGNKCAPFPDRYACVPESTYGTKNPGDDCFYSFECQGVKGYCATRHRSRFCSQSCEGPEDTCTIGDVQLNECVPYEVTRDGTPETEWACVPLGDRQGGVNDGCEINSDCQTGLTCVKGACH